MHLHSRAAEQRFGVQKHVSTQVLVLMAQQASLDPNYLSQLSHILVILQYKLVD